MKKAITKLIDLKSILMIIFAAYLGCLLSGCWNPSENTFTLFASAFSSMITYYFTKKAAKVEIEQETKEEL